MDRPRRWRMPGMARGTRAGDAFIANARAALAQVRGNAAGAADGRDPEYLHQVRVGLRRMRAVLHTFRPLLRRRKTDEFHRELRKILRALGAARDWDEFLASHRDRGLARAAQLASAGARQRASSMLRSSRFRKTLRNVMAWSASAPWRSSADPDEPAARFARRAAGRLQQTLREAAEGINWSDAAQRHKVRVKAKQLRYGCECFAAARQENEIRARLSHLRDLQRILGELNDIAVQHALLQELGRDVRLHGSAEASRAALSARERDLTAQLERSWRRVA